MVKGAHGGEIGARLDVLGLTNTHLLATREVARKTKGGVVRQLRRKQYKEFVTMHILRPYVTMLPEFTLARTYFHRGVYEKLPDMIEQNPEWAKCVFDRIAKIFDVVEADVFPSGYTTFCILHELGKRGVTIIRQEGA